MTSVENIKHIFLSCSFKVVQYIFFLIGVYVLSGTIVFIAYYLLNQNKLINYTDLTVSGHFLEGFCLSLVLLSLLAFTRRFGFSVLLTVVIYGLFMYANIEKASNLLAPVFLKDIINIKQLILVEGIISTYLPALITFTLALLVCIFVAVKLEPQNKYLKSVWLMSALLIASVLFAVNAYKIQIKDLLRFEYSIRTNNSHALNTAESYGFLFFFVKDIILSKPSLKVDDYSVDLMASIRNRHRLIQQETQVNTAPPNLIVYMIESFTDPKSAGINTTEDPVPFFRSLTENHNSGYVYAPVFGGNSANSEFELLTGFSMHFFPKSSIPYLELPHRSIPSIARELKYHGYHSAAIQPVDLGFFNYKNIYQMLGFDETISLWGIEGIEKDPAGRYPSDASVVNEIIKTSQKYDSYFVFAFPNSTHANWNYSAYDNSSLDLALDVPLQFPNGAKQLRTYVNSLKTADDAIKQLIQYFEKQKQRTAILIVGDHQPGLPEFREVYMTKHMGYDFNYKNRKEMKLEFKKLRAENPSKNFKEFHAVPYVLWTNYDIDINAKYQSGMNSLILTMFKALDIMPKTYFYQFLAKFSKTVDYDSFLNHVFYEEDNNENHDRQWSEDFEAIQYDLLFGEELISE